jgi:TonB family protein
MKSRRVHLIATVLCLSAFACAQQAGGERAREADPPKADSARLLRVRVSDRIAKRLLIKKVDPDYPAEARRNGIQGDVELRITFDKEGTVTDAALISGPTELAPAAIEAVKQWKYKPYLLNGEPVNVETRVTLPFQLPSK